MTLTIQISEKEFRKLGLVSSEVKWEDFLATLKTSIAKDALLRCKIISEKVGLNQMSLEEINAEINAEIKAVRDAKNSR